MKRSSSPGRGQHETAHQFASPVGFEIELAHQIVHRQAVHPAQHALGEIAGLARAIELEAPHLHRLAHREQPVHPQLVAPRAHGRIAAALVARADRGDRDAAVGERHGMEDVTRRGVAEQLAQLDAIGKQVEVRAPRDLEQELSEARARGVGELEQARETSPSRTPRAARSAPPIRDRTPGPPRRSRRRRFYPFHRRPRARRSVRRAAPARDPSQGNAHELEGLAKPRRALSKPHRERVARDQLAAAAAPLGQQSIAAQQRAVTDHQQCVVGRSTDGRALLTGSIVAKAARPFKHTSGRRARERPCSGLSRAGRAGVARDIRRAAPRYRRRS